MVLGNASLDGRWENIRELLAFLDEGGLDDLPIDIFEVGDLLKSIVFGIVLEQLVEGVANKERIFEFGEFSQLIQLFPTFDFVVCVEGELLPMKRVVSFMHMESPSSFSTWL